MPLTDAHSSTFSPQLVEFFCQDVKTKGKNGVLVEVESRGQTLKSYGVSPIPACPFLTIETMASGFILCVMPSPSWWTVSPQTVSLNKYYLCWASAEFLFLRNLVTTTIKITNTASVVQRTEWKHSRVLASPYCHQYLNSFPYFSKKNFDKCC